MTSKRGRPRLYNEELIVSTILQYKDSLVNIDNKIVSKLSKIWTDISRELNCDISENGLYTLVIKNRFELKDKILNTNNIANISNQDGSCNIDLSTSPNVTASTLNESDYDANHTIKIVFEKKELENLIVTKQYVRTEKYRPQIRFRKYEILQPGVWQQLITEKLWNAYKINCAYHFKRNKVYNNTITINGKCNCGSVINGEINHLNFENDNIMMCERTKGTGICGKRILRNPERAQIGKILWDRHLTAEVYRAERAEELMTVNDPEPPHLYSAKTMRNAKQEYSQNFCFDKEPLQSLLMAQETVYKNIIHNIGLNPFYVHYWSNHQIAIYREYAARGYSSIAIDATGSIITKLNRPNNNKSKHIFLYSCVSNLNNHNNFAIMQMVSESQTTNTISFWLMEWLRAKIPIPKEITCDSSKALLTAVIRVFTNYQSIDEYAAKCWDDIPTCYIRIDVAHFMKGYANFLKGVNRRIKTFFLKCVGQLILAQTLQEAEEILGAIIVIAKSETEGSLPDGTSTLSETYKQKMKHILTEPSPFEDFNSPDNETVDLDIDISDISNAYGKWANNIHNRILNQIVDNGDRTNAHFHPPLVERLMRDIKWLPLWSCICRQKFGYGRIPASSAVIEAEFNNIKCRLFANALPTRADLFVFRHIDYINGRIKLIDAQTSNISSEKEPNLKQIVETNLDEEQNLSVTKNTSLHNTDTNACLACQSGDEPTNDHSCIVCNKSVHTSSGCSQIFNIEEESKKTQRICISCQNIMSKKDILNAIDSNEVENWRGLTLKSAKKKSRYLDKNNVCLDLEKTKLKNIPILQNGNSITLKPINIKGKRMSLIQTCAFDSIFQIFLLTLFQSEEFKIKATDLGNNNAFFKMILDTFTHGISKNTYYLRAIILSEIFEAKETFDNCFIINCEVSVGYLCKKLFHDIPNLKEITSCDVCDNMREKSFLTIQIKLEDLLHSESPDAIVNSFILKPKSCHKKINELDNTKCIGTQNTRISEVGSFLILEIYDTYHTKVDVELNKIPHKLQCSFMPNEYILRGAILFKLPAYTRSSEENIVGHFTAVTYQNNTWIEYDDCRNKPQRLPGTYKTNIQIVIYSI